MAGTTAAANNRGISFSGSTERDMPPYPKPVSQAQNAAMHAAAEGRSTIGIPKKVGQEYAKGAHGKSLSKLPKRKNKKAAKSAINRGLVSEKAAKRHLGDY